MSKLKIARREEHQTPSEEATAFSARQKWNGSSNLAQIISLQLGKDQANFQSMQ